MALFNNPINVFQFDQTKDLMHFARGRPAHANTTKIVPAISGDAVTSTYCTNARLLSAPPLLYLVSYKINTFAKHTADTHRSSLGTIIALYFTFFVSPNFHLQISLDHYLLPALLSPHSDCSSPGQTFSILEISTHICTHFSESPVFSLHIQAVPLLILSAFF